METINLENESVKKLEALIEERYDEFYSVLRDSPSHVVFWRMLHMAFYKIAIRRTKIQSVAALGRYLKMSRTSLLMSLKAHGFQEWLVSRWEKN